MIISHQWNFTFIKGVKVAGTSVEMALSSICGAQDIVTPITPVDEIARLKMGQGARNYSPHPAAEQAHLERLRRLDASPLNHLWPWLARRRLRKTRIPAGTFYNHMGLAEVIAAYGPLPADYTVFCIERCPYRKVISWANMHLSLKKYRGGGEMKADPAALPDFLDRHLEGHGFTDVLNIGKYKLPDGRLGVQTILRYENIQADFAALKEKLGLPADLTLPHAKKGLMSNNLDLHQVLAPRHIARINELFHEEFTAFGYAMLEPG